MRGAPLSRAARAVAVALSFAITAFSIGAAFAEPLTLEVTQAAPSLDHLDPSRAILTIRLAEGSRQAFADFSKAHVGQKIEVRIDGNSVMKPVLREPITGGVISVNALSLEEAQQLGARLSSKAARLEVEVAQ